jgi:cell wall-associated NlpC family hydrolase
VEAAKKALKLALALFACTLLFTIAVSADTALVRANGGLNLRTGPGTEHSIICVIPNGTVITSHGAENGWVSVTYNEHSGYVSANYVIIRKDVPSRSGESGDRAEKPLGEQVVDYAKQFIGYKYTYGGASPATGFDCSGFVYYIYGQFGYSLNRTSYSQRHNGIAVEWDDMQAGDILVFSNSSGSYGHVGIYMGDGNFIHSVRTGVPVSVTSLWGSNYGRRLQAVRRIIY